MNEGWESKPFSRKITEEGGEKTSGKGAGWVMPDLQGGPSKDPRRGLSGSDLSFENIRRVSGVSHIREDKRTGTAHLRACYQTPGDKEKETVGPEVWDPHPGLRACVKAPGKMPVKLESHINKYFLVSTMQYWTICMLINF